MSDSKTTTHFDNLKISVDVTGLITYLESQAEMIPDKHSEKYKKTKSMIRIINDMRTQYNILFDENTKLMNALLESLPDAEEI